MPILTLLASPERADLTEAAVAELAAAWPLGRHRWLSPGVAVEAELALVPDDREEVWQRWQERGVDLAVQPDEARRKRVLLADMDSTMVQQECIDELAAHAGVGERVAAITARAMNGELDFVEALTERVALLRDLPTSVVDTVLAERITYTPGGLELVATMRAHGGYAALVSGGFTPFTEAVATTLGFDEHRANTLGVEGDRFAGTVVGPVVGRDAKVAALREITGRLGLTPDDAIAVGDGANDLGMLQLAGTGVALHAKPAVAAQVDVRVNHGDLTALLYLQGYAVEEFVRP
ncbi:phosphoserine phosphatase SerB [Ornithinimicrobium humiphilum]|uniref:phosphoserine phosphatase n=1 Tax=Ornithinimicrobium humiphilum TaxID=125288 RepID=A0A543KQB7_9MICO|nr:phosphoserine phosphatase SerB [Ornithinimicrobium humiphilum]TQM97247.1 phosphoserine phosphatase [Ornithinimicrobium humiphilum]